MGTENPGVLSLKSRARKTPPTVQDAFRDIRRWGHQRGCSHYLNRERTPGRKGLRRTVWEKEKVHQRHGTSWHELLPDPMGCSSTPPNQFHLVMRRWSSVPLAIETQLQGFMGRVGYINLGGLEQGWAVLR